MGKLVKDRDHSSLTGCIGDLGSKDVAFCEGNSSGIFHGSGVELWNKELIVFLERVRNTKLLLEELKALLGLFEYVLSVQILKQ